MTDSSTETGDKNSYNKNAENLMAFVLRKD